MATWRARRADLAVRADLARLLSPDSVAPARGRRRSRVQAPLRRAAVAELAGPFRGLVRGAHRLSAGRCRDATTEPERLHAQPPAYGGRVLSHQGPAGRLAAGRALLRRHAHRLRPGRQQRRLAVGRLGRLRRPALVSYLQSGHAVGTVRSTGCVHPPLPARVPEQFIHAPWTMPDVEQRRAACVIGQDYPTPIVDHAVQRVQALALFKLAAPSPAPGH